MKKLIVNADDYGYTSNISLGIRDAYKKGILTSTSVIMNFGTPIEDIYVAMKETPDLAMGVHLNLYKGKPLSPVDKVKTLVDGEGVMLGKQGVVNNALVFNVEDMETECRAQINAFLSTGQNLDHINTHGLDSICFSVEVWEIFLRLSLDYDCATRVPIDWASFPGSVKQYIKQFGLSIAEATKKYEEQMELLKLSKVFHADRFGLPVRVEQSVEAMVEMLRNMPEGLTEIANHAGYSDEILERFSTVTDERDREVAILTDPVVREAVEENRIVLTTYTKEYEAYKATN